MDRTPYGHGGGEGSGYPTEHDLDMITLHQVTPMRQYFMGLSTTSTSDTDPEPEPGQQPDQQPDQEPDQGPETETTPLNQQEVTQAALAPQAGLPARPVAPAATSAHIPPNVIVLDEMPPGLDSSEAAQPSISQDHWLSSSDGRYSSPQVLLRVGPMGNMQTFYVHKDILTKARWFRTALCGNFKEAEQQIIDLPEEDPDIFHFLVAFLYEGTYKPLRAATSALDADEPKGKGKGKGKGKAIERNPEPIVNTVDPLGPPGANRRGRNRNATTNPAVLTTGAKTPTTHRPSCLCHTCLGLGGELRCWNCGARGSDRPSPMGMHRPQLQYAVDLNMDGILPQVQMQAGPGQMPDALLNPNARSQQGTARRAIRQGMKKEDLSSWLMTYELNIDVYICAERYLVDDFRKAVERHTIDLLESAGLEAAHPKVLHLCNKLLLKVPAEDPLLKMVLARVGFLQPQLWKRAPEETQDFLVNHPEVAALMLRETVLRHDQQPKHVDLPPMEVSHALQRAGSWASFPRVIRP